MSKAIIGSQQVPFIYEDRIRKEDFIAALMRIYHATPKERQEMGAAGRRHVEENYNFTKTLERWDNLLSEIHQKYGSWDNRKSYNRWELTEL